MSFENTPKSPLRLYRVDPVSTMKVVFIVSAFMMVLFAVLWFFGLAYIEHAGYFDKVLNLLSPVGTPEHYKLASFINFEKFLIVGLMFDLGVGLMAPLVAGLLTAFFNGAVRLAGGLHIVLGDAERARDSRRRGR